MTRSAGPGGPLLLRAGLCGGRCCPVAGLMGGSVSASDIAIWLAWGALPARLERFDVTVPIILVAAGPVVARGPLAVPGGRRRRGDYGPVD